MMRQIIVKGLVMGGYLLWGITAFLFFLYHTFPFDRLQETMTRTFESHSGCRTDVGHTAKAFPLVLTWHDLQIHCPHIPALPIESFKMEAPIKPLLFQSTKKIAFHIQMPAHTGEVIGWVSVENSPEGPSFMLHDEAQNINLYPLGLEGTLNMQGNGQWTGNHPLVGIGSHTITLQDINIDLQERASSPEWVKALSTFTPLLGITTISLSTVRGEIRWQNQTLFLKTFYLKSDLAEIASGAGSLRLNAPLSQSALSMNFEVIPQGNLKQMAPLFIPHYTPQTPLTLALTGMVSSPQLSINGMRLPSFS